ncbi:MAG: hypothetical protein ACXAB4_08815, partial [Candidatus Hodarchaeales archaeon]
LGLSTVGLFIAAVICFFTYRLHRIPQFLLLGFAFFPFGAIAVIFSESSGSVYAEISVYATVVSTMYLIGFALSLLHPKILELHYFLPYSALIHIIGLSAAVITHEASATTAGWLFAPPIIVLIAGIFARASWKAYTLGATQLAVFCFVVLCASVLGGMVSIFYRSLGLGLTAYIALLGLFTVKSASQPESLAPLYREYLILSGLKRESEIFRLKDLSIGVLIFGPKGPEFFLQYGELFKIQSTQKQKTLLKLAHFYFAMLKPLLQDSSISQDTFGPMPAFSFPGMQSLVGTSLLSSKDLGDPRLQGQLIALLVLYYPSRCESLEIIRSLKFALYEYFQNISALEEISEESLQSFQQKIISQLGGNLL